MKAKKKTNHLLEEADKIEHIPEEKNDGREGQDEPNKAKKPRKNRFLARLRKTWARIIGCIRSCCTCIQDERSAEELQEPNGINMEELAGPSGINMEEELPEPRDINIEELSDPSEMHMENSKAKASTEIKEENMQENQNTKVDNEETSQEAEGVVINSLVEYQHLPDLIPSQEDLYFEDYIIQETEVVETEEELKAEYQRLLDLLHSQQDLYSQDYTSQGTEVVVTEKETEAEYQHLAEQLECKVEDEAELKIKEDGEDVQEKADSATESQRASCEMPGPCHTSSRDNESSKGKENEDNKEEDNLININEERQECRSKQMSCSRSSSLEEETPKERYKCIKTSPSGSSDDRSDSCSIDDKTVEELYKSIKASQPSSSANRSDCCSLDETVEELYKSIKASQHGSSDNTSDCCLLDETVEELYKSIKASQCGSSDNRSDSCSLDDETVKELYKSIKASQRGNSGDGSASCSLEEEIQEELHRSIKTSQSGSSHDEEPSTSDICWETLEQPGEEMPSTVPLTLDSFTFHQKLGTGNFGEVFLASDIIRKECVAIKVSNKCLFTMQGHSLVERDILELSHESPFLIHGLAVFHTEKFVYYVLELATRGDLFDFIGKNFPLDTPTIQFIMAEVICGTQFLHKKNILHQDLKSENILLTADGHIKITDFGLSAMGVYEKIKENLKGTPAYMAPEMIMGQEHGRGVDYFALGVILYDMYTCMFPFPGENAKEMHHSILLLTPLYPEFLTPDTVDILQGLLCKDQDYRLGVIGDIKQHQFFSGINWEDVEARRMKPPAAIMTADFIDMNTDQTLQYMEKQIYIRPEDQKIFKELSFVCPDWSQCYHSVNNQAI